MELTIHEEKSYSSLSPKGINEKVNLSSHSLHSCRIPVKKLLVPNAHNVEFYLSKETLRLLLKQRLILELRLNVLIFFWRYEAQTFLRCS